MYAFIIICGVAALFGFAWPEVHDWTGTMYRWCRDLIDRMFD